MRNSIAVTVALIAAVWGSASGGQGESPLQSAALAWDRGEFASALTTYLAVLDGRPTAQELEAIALQTGELYQTTELTADGAAPSFAPDGRHLLYETGPALTRRTRVLATGGLTLVAELDGFGAVFSPDGSKLAYLALTPGPASAAEKPSRIIVRDLASGHEAPLDTGALRKTTLAYGNGVVLFTGTPAEDTPVQIYAATNGRRPTALTSGDLDKTIIRMNLAGTAILFGSRPGASGERPATFGVLSIADGRLATVTGSAPSFAGDGASITYIASNGRDNQVMVAPTSNPTKGAVVRGGPEAVDAPALSPDGSRVAFQLMGADDWEIHVTSRDGGGEARVTRDIQHDIVPAFLPGNRLIAAIGDSRHRRSYLYDLPSMQRTRLFHNNTVRTIAPEYSWTPSPDGTKVLISADRDGDTASVERGVYLVDLSTRVTREQLRDRVKGSLDAEEALQAKGRRQYEAFAEAIRSIVADVSVTRVFGYQKGLFDFDSKHVSQPGNALAAEYLVETYKSFGYTAAYQPFEFRLGDGPGGKTANVIATLTGTVNPELVYVVSSHYDSVASGPGADDNGSGTAALLETARVMARHPQPATIVFASFTGEEVGLLGSREFVRRAVADKMQIVGVLNNDMIGWTNDHRLDNTIRYSNAGIRDIQHAAAMLFTNLITYDALYFKSTDAAPFYEAYGDIVGGIGSYPVLGNPHYHEPHDLLHTVNHQLVAEVSKATAATVMLLASSPSPLRGLEVDRFAGGSVTISWSPSPEKGVAAYLVSYGSPSEPPTSIRVLTPFVTLTGITPGAVVSVKAVTAEGIEGWDWAKVTVGVTSAKSMAHTSNTEALRFEDEAGRRR